jgi:hypothetical protein
MSVFGCTLTSGGGYCESIDIEKKAEVKQLLTSTGRHGAAHTYDNVFTFSARGKGTNPYTAGAGDGGLPVDGAAVITSCKTTTKNDDWEGWEITGISYEHGAVVSVGN